MSTCPSNDIHSVYLDGELEAKFLEKYESHVNSCELCSAKLEKLKALRSALAYFDEEDSNSSISLSESFERLQIKRNYNRVVKNANYSKNKKIRAIIPLAAAAAFLAFVLPLRSPSASSSSVATNVSPLTRKQDVTLAKRNIIINGNIDHAVVLSRVANQSAIFNDTDFDDADVFRPNFEDSSMSVKIILPGTSQSFVANMPIFYTSGE